MYGSLYCLAMGLVNKGGIAHIGGQIRLSYPLVRLLEESVEHSVL